MKGNEEPRTPDPARAGTPQAHEPEQVHVTVTHEAAGPAVYQVARTLAGRPLEIWGGSVATREQAWACAYAAMRGMLRASRLRAALLVATHARRARPQDKGGPPGP